MPNDAHTGQSAYFRQLRRLLLAGILLGAVYLRYGGFDRPPVMHPDQPRILAWLNRAAEDGYLKNTVYPGGFFTLFTQFRRGADIFIKAHAHWQYRLGYVDRPPPPEQATFNLGRHFNVWLAGVTCLLAGMFAAVITGSAWMGLFSALLLCFVPDHVIHAHYLQTDIAMLFTLTLALWLWALYADRRRTWIFTAAVLASGFAAGTKYTLLCLAPLGLIFSFYRQSGQLRLKRIVIMGALALLLFAAGFLLATPAAMDWNSFREGMAWQGARVYGEGVTIMGQARGEPLLRLQSHWRHLLTSMATVGWFSWLAVGLGLFWSLRQPYRKFWPLLMGFPMLYLYYYLFRAPWVRAQEFLNLLPAWSALAGLGLFHLGRIKGLARRPALLAAVCLALLILAPLARQGRLAGSPFVWTDVRQLANRWLQRHLPYEAVLGLERYTHPIHLEASSQADFIHKIETSMPALADEARFTHVIRNPTSHGRGLRHPMTGERYPRYQSAFEAFTNQAVRLRTWGLMPPEIFKTPFSSPDLELWELTSPDSSLALHVPLAQPCFISAQGHETFFSEGHELGSVEAILIDRHPRQWAVGGPAAPTGTIHAVINTYERSAQVRLNGFSAGITAAMPAYGAQVIPLRRPAWRPRAGMLEIITVATAPVPHIRYVPCLLRPAPDRETAAIILQANGHTAPARRLLEEESRAPRGNLLRYMLAVAENDWTMAAQLEDTAAAVLAQVEQALRLPPAQISINGINGMHYNRFARIRLSPTREHLQLEINDTAARVPDEHPGLPPGVEIQLPVRLAQGHFSIHMQVRVRADGGVTCAGKPGKFKVYDHRGGVIAQGAWLDFPDEFVTVELPIVAGLEVEPRLHFTSSTPVTLEYRSLELRWNLHDRLRALRNSLLAARTSHQLHSGNLPAAADSLARADFQSWNRPAWLRLELALRQAEAANPELLQTAAAQVLAAAPGYWPALAVIDPAAAARLPANLEEPVIFPPWLKLVGLHHANGGPGDQHALIFEALQDDTPPLALATHRRRGKRWRRLEQISDPTGRRLQAGERLRVPLSHTEPPDGISVMSDVRWSPGTLRPDNHPEIIPLAPLLAQILP